MRIIGGSNKRRIIKVPSGLPVRPTTDLAKEALFNILNNHFDFEAIRVLDLFSGTGNIAFEFASRGALEVIAVENNSRCVTHLHNTIKSLQFGQMVAVKADALRFITSCRSNFDIVFADPPYEIPDIVSIPDLVFKHNLLDSNGWLVLEHASHTHFDNHPNFTGKRKYGRVHFSFFSGQP